MAKKQTTELALYDEQLAKYAEQVAATEQTKGKWFSTQAGQLSFNDNPIPGNKMGVIIIDHLFENAFYPGKFTPGAIVAPDCFALSRDEDALAPHEKAQDPQHTKCEGCPMNEWGSADTGRGKACGNRRRLALLPAGSIDKNGEFDFNDDPEHYASVEAGYLKLPSTSLKGWAGYVKQLAQTLKRPPFGVVTLVEVVPDAETQFKVVFSPIMSLPNTVLGAVIARHEAMVASNEAAFPYEPMEAQPVQSKGAKVAKRQSSRTAPAAQAPTKATTVKPKTTAGKKAGQF